MSGHRNPDVGSDYSLDGLLMLNMCDKSELWLASGSDDSEDGMRCEVRDRKHRRYLSRHIYFMTSIFLSITLIKFRFFFF